jgi:hypothetical protein
VAPEVIKFLEIINQILSHPQTEWEDQVSVKVGHRKGLKVEIIGCFRPTIFKAKLVSWLKLLAREPYAIHFRDHNAR